MPRYPAEGMGDTMEGGSEEEPIRAALQRVGLGHLVDRHGLDLEVDFGKILSLGERQRLGFARLLLRRGVRLVILDEATSAQDEKNQAALYQKLCETVRCYVSVGHRSNLWQHHSHVVVLERTELRGCTGHMLPITKSTPPPKRNEASPVPLRLALATHGPPRREGITTTGLSWSGSVCSPRRSPAPSWSEDAGQPLLK